MEERNESFTDPRRNGEQHDYSFLTGGTNDLCLGQETRIPLEKPKDLIARSRETKKLPYTGSEAAFEPSQAVAQPSPQRPSAEFVRIIWLHYYPNLIRDVVALRENAGNSRASLYATSVLQMILAISEVLPNEPITYFLLALYDALVFEDSWTNYTPDQYDNLHTILRSLETRMVDFSDIAKLCVQLEKLGFDTTPYHGAPHYDDDVF